VVRNPLFTAYLQGGDYAEPVEIPSPADERIRLQGRVVIFGKKQKLIIGRDVTRIHQLEQMRRDFVANVSHELRTPLTVISGFLEPMLDDARHGKLEEWQSSLELMEDQTSRMQRIVEDLLLLSRLETDRTGISRDPVSVPSLLTGIREDALQLASDKQHRITVEANEQLWLHGSEQELRSAFSNLVFNAVRYTPAQGEIHIRWYEYQNGARLDVTDSGIGVAAQHIPRLTERFYRVDVGRSRESGGTGLGLAIVKHVLNRHQASLHIESQPGQGSTFSCIFAPEVTLHRHRIRETGS
jgi:two-component system phosphate regulon sensor histidine kinase PhoR